MTERVPAAMLVVADGRELIEGRRVWGTGGWLSPEEREALDWLTLGALAGWSVAVTGGTAGPELAGGTRWVVIARDPESLTGDCVAQLASRLAAEPLLLVARAPGAGTPFARLAGVAIGEARVEGQALSWAGPGEPRIWQCRKTLDGRALAPSPEAATWATLDGAPIIAGRRVGRGAVATLGFHPSAARDRDGAGTAILRHLLVQGALAPVAWLDLDGTLVLRMDDPGGAQNVHLRSWAHPKLGEPEWAAIAGELRGRDARLSIGYVGGWVDDGDPSRGELKVNGLPASRDPGHVHPSPRVRYMDRAGHAPGTVHDYEAEFRGIEALRTGRLGDVELHGHTHMHPDAATWARAPDRYEATPWFRELGRLAEATLAALPAAAHPLALGVAGLRRYFGVQPTTLICPGDDWTDAALEVALGLGIRLVSSYYLALRIGDRFCWAQHACAPYLDEPDGAWFDSGLPVVGYFHDRDVGLEGIGWLRRCLDDWRVAGARRLLDFRELAAAIGHRLALEEREGTLLLTVAVDDAPAPVRPIPLFLRVPGGRLPSAVLTAMGDETHSLPVEPAGADTGRVAWPVASQ